MRRAGARGRDDGCQLSPVRPRKASAENNGPQQARAISLPRLFRVAAMQLDRCCLFLRMRMFSISTVTEKPWRSRCSLSARARRILSTIKVTPTRIKNDRARILIVGCVSTKSPMALAAISITTTARMMATAMIDTCSTSPTAVMTESNEKTISRSAICSKDHAEAGRCGGCGFLDAFQAVMNFVRGFGHEE